MTAQEPSQSDSIPDYLQGLIADFLGAEDRGEAIDRKALLRDHAEHADSLRAFFVDHDLMRKASAEPKKPGTGNAATLPPQSPSYEDATLASNAFAPKPKHETAVGDRVVGPWRFI